MAYCQKSLPTHALQEENFHWKLKFRYFTDGKFAKFKFCSLLYFQKSLNDSVYTHTMRIHHILYYGTSKIIPKCTILEFLHYTECIVYLTNDQGCHEIGHYGCLWCIYCDLWIKGRALGTCTYRFPHLIGEYLYREQEVVLLKSGILLIIHDIKISQGLYHGVS